MKRILFPAGILLLLSFFVCCPIEALSASKEGLDLWKTESVYEANFISSRNPPAAVFFRMLSHRSIICIKGRFGSMAEYSDPHTPSLYYPHRNFNSYKYSRKTFCTSGAPLEYSFWRHIPRRICSFPLLSSQEF